MTDGLLPGVDRDLVRPLQKRLESDFAAIYLGDEGRLAGRQDKTRSKSPSTATCRSGSSGSAACWCASAGVPTAPVWGWKTPPWKSTPTASSRSTSNGAPPTRTSWPSATWPASRCWRTRPAHEGKAAVEGLSGKAVAFEPQAIPAVVFTDPEIAWAGLTETEAKSRGIAVEVAQFPWAASGRAQAIGRTEGLTKWVIDPQSQRLLGCGIVGAGAGDLVERGRLGHRNGLLSPRPGRDDPSAPHAQRDARRRGRGVSGIGNGPLSAEAKRMKRKG